MSILSVRHRTRYTYRRPVRLGDHRLMLRPRDSFDQRLLESGLDISPAPKNLHWIHDVFGNCVTIVSFAAQTDELTFDSRIVLEHTPSNAPDFTMEDYAHYYPFTYSAEEMPDLSRSIE